MDRSINMIRDRPTLHLDIETAPSSSLSSPRPYKPWSPTTSGSATPRDHENKHRTRAELELIRQTSRYDGLFAEVAEAEQLRSRTTSPVSPRQRRITRSPSPIRSPDFLKGTMIEYSSTWLKNHPEIASPTPKRSWPQDVSEAGEELAWQLDPEMRVRIEEGNRRRRKAKEVGRKGGAEDFLERVNEKKASLPPPPPAPPEGEPAG